MKWMWTSGVLAAALATPALAEGDDPPGEPAGSPITDNEDTGGPPPAPPPVVVIQPVPTGESTARDTASAPLPGDESGRLDNPEHPDSTGRVIARGILFVPKMAYEVLMLPFRGISYVYDRYALEARFKHFFFNDAETMGLYPTLALDTTYGVTVGGRFVHRDLFGEHEHVMGTVGFGGRYHQLYDLRINSGERFGKHFVVEGRGEIERRPHDAFYGIGNGAAGVESRHSQDLERVSAIADVNVISDLHLRFAGAATHLSYGDSKDTEPSIEMVYDTSMLTGFMSGVRHLYGELEVRWDSRRAVSMWDAPILPATGWFVSVYNGFTDQLNELDNYWRTGFDVQRFFWLGRGPRVLSLRVAGESVNGDYDDVSFTELPHLGGKKALRGYAPDRFRDRVALLTSAEYQWDLNRNIAMNLFSDLGRVYSSVDAINASDLRLGFGLGVTVMTGHNFLAEASIASSIDGGAFFYLAFDPVYDVDPRVVRR